MSMSKNVYFSLQFIHLILILGRTFCGCVFFSTWLFWFELLFCDIFSSSGCLDVRSNSEFLEVLPDPAGSLPNSPPIRASGLWALLLVSFAAFKFPSCLHLSGSEVSLGVRLDLWRFWMVSVPLVLVLCVVQLEALELYADSVLWVLILVVL